MTRHLNKICLDLLRRPHLSEDLSVERLSERRMERSGEMS